jgi:IS605 OrfB family transposase
MKNKKENNSFIRSSKVSTKFVNKSKLNAFQKVQKEYRKVMLDFIDILWEMKEQKLSSLPSKEITDKIDTWLSARLVQCAGKQATAIVKGTLQKQNKRLFIYNKLQEEKNYKKARKLKLVIDKINISKPAVSEFIPLELDERFVKIDLENDTIFDGWLTFSSIGEKLKLTFPFKKTEHFNKFSSFKMLKGVRLTNKFITFMFECEPKQEVENTNKEVIGLDVGIKNTISCSNGHQTQKDIHGHDLDTIQKKLSRKKKGSKSFERTQKHRTNYINWSLNQLDLANVSTVKCEKIKNLRKNSRTSRYLSSWTYTEIFSKLERLCEEQNVSLIRVSPTYTSQRCSLCSWVQKKNRQGKQFKCVKCGFTFDADLNASKNISLNLREIGKKERLLQKNRTGFYWFEEGREFIVLDTQKDKS